MFQACPLQQKLEIGRKAFRLWYKDLLSGLLKALQAAAVADPSGTPV
jgi:hypothetical protein